MPTNRRLAAIMFADIVGYTAMMHRDEAAGMMRLKRFRLVLEQSVDRHGGQILQHYGDGSLVIYDSAVNAVESAREIQLALREEPFVPLRIGLHVGDIVIDGEYIYGDGVNVASRVEEQGVAGSVLVTDRVIYDIRNHPEFRLQSLGQFELKNVAEPVEIFALIAPGIAVPEKTNDQAAGRTTASRKKRPAYWPVIALLALLLISGAVYGWMRWSPAVSEARSETPGKSIVVLPFRDLSASREEDYFGDGIAEEILNGLAQIPELKVAGRSSAFSFKNKTTSPQEIGEELGVSTLLEGSVRKAGDRVRVTAQLVSTEDGYQLWSERYDRNLDDIFAIQDEIARAVVGQLRGIFNEKAQPRVVKELTSNQEAYEWYLRGKHLLSQRADGAERAVEFFERAIALDSSFAAAYAGLGNAYLWLGWSNLLPSRQAFPAARDYARQALALDNSLAYAHTIIGSVNLWYEWDWAAARQSLERAVQLNPSEAGAYLDLGWRHAIGGDAAGAIALMEKAVSLDPLNLEYNIDLADLCRMTGRLDRAAEITRAMRETFPENSEVYWLLGMIAFNQGDDESAIENFREAVRLSGDQDWAEMALAMALALAGEAAEAGALLRDLEKTPALAEAAPVEMAPIYWHLGRRDQALAWLEKSYEWHANWMISLELDPLWDPMRQEPAFQELVRKMDFPAPAAN